MTPKGWHGLLFGGWKGQNGFSGVPRHHHGVSTTADRQRGGAPPMVAEIETVIFFRVTVRCVMVAETEVSTSKSSENVRSLLSLSCIEKMVEIWVNDFSQIHN